MWLTFGRWWEAPRKLRACCRPFGGWNMIMEHSMNGIVLDARSPHELKHFWLTGKCISRYCIFREEKRYCCAETALGCHFMGTYSRYSDHPRLDFESRRWSSGRRKRGIALNQNYESRWDRDFSWSNYHVTVSCKVKEVELTMKIALALFLGLLRDQSNQGTLHQDYIREEHTTETLYQTMGCVR